MFTKYLPVLQAMDLSNWQSEFMHATFASCVCEMVDTILSIDT